jgi:phage-related protein
MRQAEIRPVFWVSGSRKDMGRLPAEVRQDLGFLLFQVQAGKIVPDERPLNKGVFKNLGIRELIADSGEGTYRLVYAVQLRAGVYVLHAFQKKSTHGIATPQHELDVVLSRYRLARAMDEAAARS